MKTQPRVGEDLVEWLRVTFPPRCIRKHENPDDARWYAAQVELAETIISMGTRQEHRPTTERSVEIE